MNLINRKTAFVAGVLVWAAVVIFGVACHEEPPARTVGALGGTAANISYQVTGSFGSNPAAVNLSTGQAANVPAGGSITLQLQSVTGIQKVTYAISCPGYPLVPYSTNIIVDGAASSSAYTFTMPTAEVQCTVTTTVSDSTGPQGNTVTSYNGLYVMQEGVVEVNAVGPTYDGGAGTIAAFQSNTVIPSGSLITKYYLNITSAFDAGCTYMFGLAVDGGATSNLGWWDSGTTLVTGTYVNNVRQYVDATAALQFNGTNCYGVAAGQYGVEYVQPFTPAVN